MKPRSPRPAFLLALSLTAAQAHAQQTVSIPIPGTSTAITADLYGTGHHAVVLAHGGRFDKASWHEQATQLAAAGFTALAIQYRGDTRHPDGTPSADGSPEDNAADVLAAIAFCYGRGATAVFAIGGSLGGDAVADASARSRPGELDRIVLLGSAAGAHPSQLHGRTLFIVARDDRSSSGLRLPDIQAAFARAPQPRQLILLDGSAHAQALFRTPAAPQLMKTILHFLSQP